MISKADRSAISRAVAKAIAYHNASKQEQADRWVVELVRLLGRQGHSQPSGHLPTPQSGGEFRHAVLQSGVAIEQLQRFPDITGKN